MKNTEQIFLEWDVATWSAALRFWEKRVGTQAFVLQYGLEIGARNAGLSLFFASRYGATMECTDVKIPAENVQHRQAALAQPGRLHFSVADAAQLPFPDESFDFVCFKSVLGVIGSHGRPEQMEQAIAEIYRVLKPGGAVFWAENLRASKAHALARRLFVPWGKAWHYLSCVEMASLFQDFNTSEWETAGFLAAFVPHSSKNLKNLAARIDRHLRFLPLSWHYVGFGIARKG